MRLFLLANQKKKVGNPLRSLSVYNKTINRKKEKYSNLSDEELNRMLEQLEAEFNREYQFRAHNQNGLEENENDFISDYNKAKKKIEDAIKLTKKELMLMLKRTENTILVPNYKNGLVEVKKQNGVC